MSKILKVTQPVISVDVDDANLLSVLCVYDQTENYKRWFIRNFLDLWCFDDQGTKVMGFDKPRLNHLHCFRKEVSKHDYYDRPFPDSSPHDCELLHRIELDKDTLEKKYDTIVDMIKEYVDQDYFLFFEIDCFYVPVALFNGKIHYNSRTLFYGYDDEKQCVNVADFYGPFDRNVAYKFRELSYQDLIKAYSSYECVKNIQYDRLLTFRYREKEIPINKGEIKYALKRYTQGMHDIDNKIHFGMKVYDAIEEELEKKYLDFRVFNYVAAHAKASNLRVKYMTELGVINENEAITKAFATFEKQAYACRNVLFKFVVSQDRDVRTKVIDSYKKLKETDQECMGLLMDSITGEENVYRWSAGLKQQNEEKSGDKNA